MIILTCTCNKLWHQALQKPEMTLVELLSLGRTMALAEIQASGMELTQQCATEGHLKEDVMAVEMRSVKKICYNCSGTFPHREGMLCPAQEEICNACGKRGHFAKCCRARRPQISIRDEDKMHYVHTSENSGITSQAAHTADTESSEEYLYTVIQPRTNLPHAKIMVSDCSSKVMLDSGATVNIINETTNQRLRYKPSLTKSTVPVFLMVCASHCLPLENSPHW